MSPNVVLWILVLLAAGGAVGLVFYGEEQGWGGGLTVGVAVGMFLAVAVLYAVYEAARKRRRREGTPQAAALLGLVPADRSAVPHLPFELMSRGQGRTVENVMTGSLDGTVWLFDYTYYTTSYNPNTHSTNRNDFYFSSAVGELRASGLPAVRISREGFFPGSAGPSASRTWRSATRGSTPGSRSRPPTRGWPGTCWRPSSRPG